MKPVLFLILLAFLPEVGNFKSCDDARHGFWHGTPARVWHLLNSRYRSSRFDKEVAGTNAHFVTEDIEGQLNER